MESYKYDEEKLNKNIYDGALTYSVVTNIFAAIHILLVFIFFFYQFYVLMVYNIFSFIFYIIVSICLKHNKTMIFFIGSFAEIVIHIILTIVFIGWQFNFVLYFAAIMPISFYFVYLNPKIANKIRLPLIVSLISIVLIYITYILTNIFGTVYYSDILSDYSKIFINGFNYFICMICLIAFSTNFISKIKKITSELEEKNDILEHLAYYDQLTGLLNRRHINKKFEEAVDAYSNNNTPFSIILGDIDDFKKVNDTYGHNCGDNVLQIISEVIIDSIGDNGYACRWGGEEILIIIYNELKGAVDKAEEIRKIIEGAEIEYHSSTIKITITLGVAQYNPNTTISNTIIEADNKMYIGKQNSKNQVIA